MPLLQLVNSFFTLIVTPFIGFFFTVSALLLSLPKNNCRTFPLSFIIFAIYCTTTYWIAYFAQCVIHKVPELLKRKEKIRYSCHDFVTRKAEIRREILPVVHRTIWRRIHIELELMKSKPWKMTHANLIADMRSRLGGCWRRIIECFKWTRWRRVANLKAN